MTARARRSDPRGRFAVIGLVTVILIVAGAIVSYRANSGLPLQSSYRVTVDVPDAARLVVNNAVRIAGVRVGQVDAVTAVPGADGAPPYARLDLRLQASAGPLPRDTLVAVRSASPLGGSFVELTPGRSSETIADGGGFALRSGKTGVQVTDLLDVFDSATRRSVRGVLRETGPGFAGRGGSLNRTIGDLARLMAPAERVLRTAADDGTQLARALGGYERTLGELAPVSAQLVTLLERSATTAAALTTDRTRLDRTIRRLHPAEVAATRALRSVEPTLDRLATVAVGLRPGVQRLAPALDALSGTLRVARPPMRTLRSVAPLLRTALDGTGRLSRAPATAGTLRQLLALAPPTEKLFAALTPAQVQCNLYGVFMENAVSVLGTTGNREGSFELASVSTLGAENELFQNATISRDLSLNPTPVMDETECEAGNEPRVTGAPVRGNSAGQQYDAWRETTQPSGARAKATAAGLYASPGEAGK